MKKEYFHKLNREYDLVIHWSITNYCNFSCHGCSGKAKKVENGYIPERIDISALKKVLSELNRTIKIVFTGGEPLLIENIIDAFAEITSKNYITLITNLTNPKIKELAEKIDPNRVIILKASAHILELEKYNLLDTFLDHYNLLREKGFPILTEEVAYPIMASKAKKYKKLFLDRGIVLNFQAFRGVWEGKKYPDAYTDEEYRIFNFSDIAAATPAMHNRRNKKCNAGYNAIVGNPNGNIYRCFAIKDYMGNLYKGIKLDKTLIECPLDYCDCPLSVFEPDLFKKAIEETENHIL